MINLLPNKTQFDSYLTDIEDKYQNQIKARESMYKILRTMDFPTKKDEDWRFTDLAQLLKTEYQFSVDNSSDIPKKIIADKRIKNGIKIVLVNGKFQQQFSNNDTYSNILNITNINENNVKLIDNSNPFLLMNGTFYNGGYQLDLKPNCSCEKPLHILNIISNDIENIQQHHLNNINIGTNSQITIFEEIIYLNQTESFNNIVAEFQIKDNSTVNYTLIQDYHPKVKQFNHHFVEQFENSNLNLQSINIGGNLVRNDFQVNLISKNCTANIAGLNLLTDKNHIENYLSVNHIKPNSNSKQFFKYILNKKSHGVFNGLVKVSPMAQKSDSQQANKNILLSKDALMNANPQLQIEADDVKCTHGSATGELDQDVIFYLRSRGIDLSSAKALLLTGFAKEILNKIPNKSIRDRLITKLNNWLKQ